jgi:murein DD-endopeptidase MepM/ murein hydrolase activator NlpD
MVRRGIADRLTIAAAIIVPLLVTGCTRTPEPYFGWDVQTKQTRRVAAVKPKPRPAPTYNESRYANDRYCDSYYERCDDRSYDRSYATPAPRPTQKWYDRPADDRDDRRNEDYRPSRPSQNYAYNNSNVRFQWPLRGRVVSEFGSYPSGEKNNGINIATADREPIRAAADGNVSYAGNELRGYGNLVLIKHDNGYITAYAHADHFVVERGQWVQRGQVIGYVGSTGDVRTPQLHFEVRRGTHGETPVDPRQVLGSMQVAYR